MKTACSLLFTALLVLSTGYAQDFVLYQNPFLGGALVDVDSHGVVWYQLGSCMIGFDPATGHVASYILPASTPGSVAVDASDGVWFYSSEAWRLYDGVITIYSSLGSGGHELAASPDGSVWASCMRTDPPRWLLMRFQDGTWAEHDSPSAHGASQICFEADGTGWFVFMDGLGRYRDAEWTFFQRDMTLEEDDMVPRQPGEVWVASVVEGKVNVFQDGQFVRSYGVSDGLAGSAPKHLGVDIMSRVWVGDVFAVGVSIFDGQNWTVFNTLNSGLPSNAISGIASGPDGSVYFTTDKGLARYQNGIWNCYTGASPPGAGTSVISNDIWSVAANDRGQVFYGTGSGQVGYHDGSRWQVLYQPEITFPDEVLRIAFGPADSIWFACGSALKEWQGTTINYMSTGHGGIGLGSCTDICRDTNGDMWVCCGSGVAKHQPDNKWLSWSVVGASPSIRPLCVACDLQGKVWVGTDLGLATFQDDAVVNWRPQYPYANRIACDDEGLLWVGFTASAMGLLHFDGENELAWYTVNDGLPSNWINCIACDSANHIWVGTDKGLAYFDRSTWTKYDTDSGLPANEIRDISVAPNGDVWFATPAGLICRESGVQPAKLSISIATDKPLYHAGDTMTVSLSYHNPGPAVFVDIQVACQLPDGSLYYYPGGDTPVPFSSGLLPSGASIPMVLVLTYEFPSGFPVGDYTWMTAMFAQGTFNILTDIATAPFTFQ